MTARSKRRNARKRQRKSHRAVPSFDIHARHLMDSVVSIEALARQFAGMDKPEESIQKAFDEAVAEFVCELERFEPHRLLEVARMAYLPWARVGQMTPNPEAKAAHIELLALIALSAMNQRSQDNGFPTPAPNEMSRFVSEATERLNNLLEMSHLRALAAEDPTNRLAMINQLLRGSQVLVRHTSYAEMVEQTLIQLFDGNPDVRATLTSELGFDVKDALAVLKGCHDLQQNQFNCRGAYFAEVLNTSGLVDEDAPIEEGQAAIEAAFTQLFEPDVGQATVDVNDLVRQSGVPLARTRAVCKSFRVDLSSLTPSEVVQEFMSGNNPLRTRPMIVTPEGRLMMPHGSLTMDAIKENLEEHLKSSIAWDKYVKHRGELLEQRTSGVLQKVMPGAVFRDGFEYYVPASEAELALADPKIYTKRVEGDHLIILDDVAVIIEDKAVALSALSRGGKTNRIRTDLTGLITKAAAQAGRLRELIERDGGVRVEAEGWVDLSQVREIHTVAVSLDDLGSVTTATIELVRAGILEPDNIPWTVSLHDLELISELIERPAEFLLYLRRRLNPNATVMFSASDELDLFLFFFEDGLWVEPDPELVRSVFSWLPAPTTIDRRRFREQTPSIITSRTDALDAWYYSKIRGDNPPATKPKMVTSPLGEVIDELQSRRVEGWLSIGATLLGAATKTQHQLARNPKDLLDAPAANGLGRSMTIPFAGTTVLSEAWLMVWGTRPVDQEPVADEKLWRDYLRSKKYQLKFPRAAAFIYDEGTRALADVYYDGHSGELPEDLRKNLVKLHPASSLTGRLHPDGKRARR